MYKIGDGEQEFTKEEVQERREEVLPLVLDIIKRVEEIEDGYALHFDSGDQPLSLLLQWLTLERIINEFLRFQLSIESNHGPVRLEMSGPSGIKDFLQSELNLKRWL